MDWNNTTGWLAALWRKHEEGAQEICGPWGGGTRTAVIKPWFSVKGNARAFGGLDLEALETYRPRVVAGPLHVLRHLAELTLDGRLALPAPERGLIALGGIGRPVVAQRDRDLCWEAFHAPVFEEFRSWSGELLAWECEAHEGLHIVSEQAVFGTCRKTGELRVAVAVAGGFREPLPTGLTGRVVAEPCGCGRPGARLTEMRIRTEPLAPPVAVGA